MERVLKRQAASAAGGAAVILLILLFLTVLGDSPDKNRIRALLKLRTNREMTVLVLGGPVHPALDPNSESSRVHYRWFAGSLKKPYPYARILLSWHVAKQFAVHQFLQSVPELLRETTPDITILCIPQESDALLANPELHNSELRSLIDAAKRLGGVLIIEGAVPSEGASAAMLTACTRGAAFDAGVPFIDAASILNQTGRPLARFIANGRLTAEASMQLANALIVAFREDISPGYAD